uniref:Uncharacterized protein n=1 Tax=Arundo donax TaxID=35708 RepID=A0A0A9FNC2_ARUDO
MLPKDMLLEKSIRKEVSVHVLSLQSHILYSALVLSFSLQCNNQRTVAKTLNMLLFVRSALLLAFH